MVEASKQQRPVPVATVVPVGVEAIVGDVVVAAAVVTESIDDKVRLVAQRHGTAMKLTLAHRGAGELAEFIMQYDSERRLFNYAPGGVVFRADSLLGDKFRAFAELADFSFAVGFCPKTAVDLRDRLLTVGKHATRLVRDRYPDCILRTSPWISDSLNLLMLKNAWNSGSGTKFPSTKIDLTDEAQQLLTQADEVRILFSSVITEAIAIGVRSARILDQGVVYPVLRLENNMGYSSKDLYWGLSKLDGFDVKGIRNEITREWMAHIQKTMSGQSTSDDGDSKGTLSQAKGEVFKDNQGRDALPFDRREAVKMAAALKLALDNNTPLAQQWRDKTRAFVQSIHDQLEKKRRLSPRQMFVLTQVFKGRMNW
jgi:hypothetical protein